MMPPRFYVMFWIGDLKRAFRRAKSRLGAILRPWVHTPHDGRGGRDVYLDGHKVERVVYADVSRGIIRAHHNPVKVNKRRGQIITFKRYGKVEVRAQGEVTA